MTSVVEICNMALSHTGTDIFIADIDEKNKEARLCKLWYPICRDRLLRTFDWSWAKVVADLAESGTPDSGWQYRYQYPVDALKVLVVAPQDAPLDRRSITRYRWEVTGSGGILSNVYQAQCLYISKVTDPGRFDDTFAYALGVMLAANIAMALTGDIGRTGQLQQAAAAAISDAIATNAGEGYEGPQPDALATQVRFGFTEGGM